MVPKASGEIPTIVPNVPGRVPALRPGPSVRSPRRGSVRALAERVPFVVSKMSKSDKSVRYRA